MGRIVIKLLSSLYNHSFVLSSVVLHCLYIRYDFLCKIPRTITRILVSGCYGLLLEHGVRESSVIKTPLRYLCTLSLNPLFLALRYRWGLGQ